MNILHLIVSIDPQSGGTVEGVRRLYGALLELGHPGDVLCLDAPDTAFVHEFPGQVHALGPVTSTYAYTPALVPWLKSHAARYDAVIVHGLWQYPGLAVRQVLVRPGMPPYFVFTHGMLDPWFKRRYPLKHLKKWLYWPWGEYRVLRDAAAVLFTCEEERISARQSFWLYQCNEVVSSFGTSDVPAGGEALATCFLDAHPILRGKRLILFLGRIHEKKGCDLLLEAFARTCPRMPDIHLVMAGPDSQGWGATLRARAVQLGIAHRISWTGMLAGEHKWGAFYASDVFCLPSHQENFGVAVAEALACGLPALMSDKVNIWREIQTDAAGLIAPDTLEGTERLLHGWLSMWPAERSAMRLAARRCFERRFRMERVAENVVRIIEQAHNDIPFTNTKKLDVPV